MLKNELIKQIACINDYREYAKKKIKPSIWSYIEGASADEISKHLNELAWQNLHLKTRVLSDIKQCDINTTLLGQSHPHPVVIAPVAYQKLVCDEGELATIQAANAQQAIFTASTLSSTHLEEIAAACPNSKRWFQLYIQNDLDDTLSLIHRAEQANYSALVITVDAPINGLRNREQRSGFKLPSHIRALNLENMPNKKQLTHPPSLEQLIKDAPTWKTIASIKKHTALPILIKGVMCPEDAKIATNEGASGIIVSNHGGRTLDTQPATVDAISNIIGTIGSGYTILIDGGIRRGTDILKAKALGADAVMIGRPIMYALSVSGALGVAHSLKILQDELKMAMAFCGYSTYKQIDHRCLF